MPTEQSFPDEGISALEIDLKRGDIAVDVGDGDQITLRANFSSGTSEADLQVLPLGGTLRIVQSPADVEREGFGFLNDLGLGHLMGHLGRIDLRLSVPAG